jgi:hypothetical protein
LKTGIALAATGVIVAATPHIVTAHPDVQITAQAPAPGRLSTAQFELTAVTLTGALAALTGGYHPDFPYYDTDGNALYGYYNSSGQPVFECIQSTCAGIDPNAVPLTYTVGSGQTAGLSGLLYYLSDNLLPSPTPGLPTANNYFWEVADKSMFLSVALYDTTLTVAKAAGASAADATNAANLAYEGVQVVFHPWDTVVNTATTLTRQALGDDAANFVYALGHSGLSAVVQYIAAIVANLNSAAATSTTTAAATTAAATTAAATTEAPTASTNSDVASSKIAPTAATVALNVASGDSGSTTGSTETKVEKKLDQKFSKRSLVQAGASADSSDATTGTTDNTGATTDNSGAKTDSDGGKTDGKKDSKSDTGSKTDTGSKSDTGKSARGLGLLGKPAKKDHSGSSAASGSAASGGSASKTGPTGGGSSAGASGGASGHGAGASGGSSSGGGD